MGGRTGPVKYRNGVAGYLGNNWLKVRLHGTESKSRRIALPPMASG